jgi:hypothetical protein
LFFIPLNDAEDNIYKELNIEGPRKSMVGGIYTFLIELDRYAKRGIEGKTIVIIYIFRILKFYYLFVQKLCK